MTNNYIKRGWVVRFLNLPPQQQIGFLYRYSLQRKLREEIENQVFNQPKGE